MNKISMRVLPANFSFLCFAMLLACGTQMQGEITDLALTKVIRNKVDSAMTISGKWGTYINGKSYQQVPLDTHKGWQYATYYDQKRRLSIARRKLPAGKWEVIHFDDYLFEGNDNHNVTVLGICRKDGTIHLAFDHHVDPLHYRVSKAGVASNPDQVEWNASLFSEVRNWLQPQKQIDELTYPMFVPSPNGNLLLISRRGLPTSGRVRIASYDPQNGGWTAPWEVTTNEGEYQFDGQTSKGRYAYLNGVHYGPNGRLHISWCWREKMGRAVRDLNYAYSDDHGLSWRNSAGEKIGGGHQLIGNESPGVKVWDINPLSGLELMMGQYVDGLDRPHVIISHRRNDQEPFALGVRHEDRSAYYHYWRNDKGLWQQNEVFSPAGGGPDSERNRAKILSTPDHDLIAMFNNKANIVILGATAKNQYRAWKVIHQEEGPWDGEPLPDLSRWKNEGVLSIYMQKQPTQDGQASDLYVVDLHGLATRGKQKSATEEK